MGRWRDGGGEDGGGGRESVSMCLSCSDINSENLLLHIVLLSDVAGVSVKGLNDIRRMRVCRRL